MLFDERFPYLFMAVHFILLSISTVRLDFRSTYDFSKSLIGAPSYLRVQHSVPLIYETMLKTTCHRMNGDACLGFTECLYN